MLYRVSRKRRDGSIRRRQTEKEREIEKERGKKDSGVPMNE